MTLKDVGIICAMLVAWAVWSLVRTRKPDRSAGGDGSSSSSSGDSGWFAGLFGGGSSDGGTSDGGGDGGGGDGGGGGD
jgi:hypothetical protein